MANNDPSGYYRALGLTPDATPAAIKAAYRNLAKKLHPDLNHGVNTTSEFQALQEAFNVLGEDDRRAQYDSYCKNHSDQSERQNEQQHHFDPVICSVCSIITAQPRIRIFYLVIGYLLGAYKKPLQGIYCTNFELKTAMKATIPTILLGWWSIHGFFWTMGAMFSNLIGGRFYVQNAYLQGRQAFYFAQEGKLELSGATAHEALILIKKARGGSGWSNQNDSTEGLNLLQKSLESLIGALPGSATVKRLKSIDGIRNRRFIFQAAIAALLACIVVSAVYIISIEQEQEAQVKERKESDRLQQEGIARAQAEAIAAQQETELLTMEKPLPQSGVYHSEFGPPQNDWPPFKINNAPGENALVKLVRISDGLVVISIFVRAGESVTANVPLGSYTGKIASGQTWYGDQIRFGPNTNYGKFDKIFDFKIKVNELSGNEITLTRLENGNMQKSSIDPSQF